MSRAKFGARQATAYSAAQVAVIAARAGGARGHLGVAAERHPDGRFRAACALATVGQVRYDVPRWCHVLTRRRITSTRRYDMLANGQPFDASPDDCSR
jgi:hypothetical protein